MTASEDLARNMHATYEKLAPEFGYETRSDSAVPWEDVPDANRKLMIAVAGTMLRNGYTRTWVKDRESDEDFPPDSAVILSDPNGDRWHYDADRDGWICAVDPDICYEWDAALDEVGSLREVIS